MGIEIERKFLIKKRDWPKMDLSRGELYRQGYLLTDPSKTVRVRQTADRGFITVKGISAGATRAEFEYEIPFAEAGELIDRFATTELSKVRYHVRVGNHLWEIDEFKGPNEGLLIAEIELKTETESFELPSWIDREVTGEERYYNSNLTLHPFQSWK